jgi:hypothetical protein
VLESVSVLVSHNLTCWPLRWERTRCYSLHRRRHIESFALLMPDCQDPSEFDLSLQMCRPHNRRLFGVEFEATGWKRIRAAWIRKLCGDAFGHEGLIDCCPGDNRQDEYETHPSDSHNLKLLSLVGLRPVAGINKVIRIIRILTTKISGRPAGLVCEDNESDLQLKLVNVSYSVSTLNKGFEVRVMLVQWYFQGVTR